MTSTSPPAYPAEYYYPEFIDNRPDNPRLSSPKPPPLLAKSVTVTKNPKQSTNRTKKTTKSLAIDVVTDHGLPDMDINEAAKADPKKSLIRDPTERNIPRLLVDENIFKQSVRFPPTPVTNLDDIETIESRKIPNGHTNGDLSIRTKPIETTRRPQHQIVKVIEDEQPIDDYWKKEILIDDEGVVAIEPVTYDKNTYEGPFGLTRKGSFIFYIGMGIFTLLSALFLIMTGVFYAQGYPDSSSKTGELTGMGICAFSFYLGLQLILIAIWHQKHRRENPIKKVKKKSTLHNDSTDFLKTSMEDNEQYDYSYQQPMDYPPYGYYSNPPYVSNVNEQMLLQQPVAATGAGYYDSVIWPSNVEVETQPDPKFLQPMEWSFGPEQQSIANESSLNGIQTSTSNKIKKSKRKPTKPVEAELRVDDFDSFNLNSNIIEQPLPNLPKAPETAELIQSLALMEPSKDKSLTNSGSLSKKNNQIKSIDSTIDGSSSNNRDKNQKRHHRHRHRHHRYQHHSRPYHHHRSHSPCSQCTYYPHDFHHDHILNHHHHPAVHFPRIVTPQFPRILTPSPRKKSTMIYRDTAISTGNETKIMHDSSVAADLDDVPNTIDNCLERIPIIRRTIIVEPYPAQPSSQVIVRPKENLIGKISLSKNSTRRGNNETIIYPSTVYSTKKSKKKKKSTIINNNIIEDLQLEDVNDDNDDGNDDYVRSLKMKNGRVTTKKTVKNAFYN